MQREPGLTADDRVLAVTTLSFDIAVLELLLPLTVGARVVLASRETAADGRALAARLASSRATVMQATPATWRMLIDAGWGGTAGLKILCGGEALSRDLADALVARGAGVWNMYGPTETTVWSSVDRVRCGGATHDRATRSRTRGCMCWTRAASPCRSACPASCSSPATAWRAATSAVPS